MQNKTKIENCEIQDGTIMWAARPLTSIFPVIMFSAKQAWKKKKTSLRLVAHNVSPLLMVRGPYRRMTTQGSLIFSYIEYTRTSRTSMERISSVLQASLAVVHWSHATSFLLVVQYFFHASVCRRQVVLLVHLHHLLPAALDPSPKFRLSKRATGHGGRFSNECRSASCSSISC